MNIKALLLGTAACAVMAASAFAQSDAAATNAPKRHHHHMAVSTGSDRLDLLEKRVEQQAAEIDALKAQLGSGAPSQVSAAQFEALQNQVYETEAAVKVRNEPKDKKLHFHGVTVTFGGFAAAESVWRSNNEESDIGSSFSKIPFGGPGGGGNGNAAAIGHTGELRFSARQSRVSGLVEGDVDPSTHLAFYGEFDFLGAAASANSNESNSYTPRIRNLYGTVDLSDIGLHFLFGQSWSLATLNGSGISERTELSPPTIDAQYVPGFVWTRQPQLRVVENIDDQIWLGLSLENPQTTIAGTAPSGYTGLVTNNGNSFSAAGANGTADAEFNPGIQLSLNHVPDVIAKIAVEPGFFDGNVHLEVFGIYRDFYDRFGQMGALSTVANHDTTGGGGGIAGLIKVIPGFLDFQADAMIGSGIGRYGSGQLSDVTYNANGTLQPINEDMEMVGLTLHATHDWDIYAFGGHEHEDKTYFSGMINGTMQSIGYGNPSSNNTGCYNYNRTASCTGNLQDVNQLTVGTWDTVYGGDFGKLRVGLQYSYTENKAMTGIDTYIPAGLGAPHTHDNMVFTSFRYYPF